MDELTREERLAEEERQFYYEAFGGMWQPSKPVLSNDKVGNPIKLHEIDPKREGDLISFEECPYKCIHGYIFDPYIHKRYLCKFCEEHRSKIASMSEAVKIDRDMKEILAESGIYNYTPKQYSFDNVLGSIELKSKVNKEDLKVLEDKLKGLIQKASCGEAPESSEILVLPRRSHPEEFLGTVFTRYYRAGRKVYRVLPVSELRESRYVGDCKLYNRIVKEEVLYVDMGVGYGLQDIDCVGSLLHDRARLNKATVIITNDYKEAILSLKAEAGSEPDLERPSFTGLRSIRR